MKTCLVTPCYLDGVDGLGSSRLERNLRYFRHYKPLKEKLGIEKIFFLDNASSAAALETLSKEIGDDGAIIAFADHLSGGTSRYDYPYCWRALYTIEKLICHFGFEKIVTIDSDCFVLSERLAAHIRLQSSGWTSLWCPKYRFPEASFHILCPDAYPLFKQFVKIPQAARNGTIMEWSLPFTHIHREFNSDRFGEKNESQRPEMDLYCQARLTQPLEFMGMKAEPLDFPHSER